MWQWMGGNSGSGSGGSGTNQRVVSRGNDREACGAYLALPRSHTHSVKSSISADFEPFSDDFDAFSAIFEPFSANFDKFSGDFGAISAIFGGFHSKRIFSGLRSRCTRSFSCIAAGFS
jgi:hypothetical protein